MIKRVMNFLTTDIWRLRLKDMSRSKSFVIRQLRVVLLAWRGFDEDKCQLRASALTFYSLLSVVPVVAMAFGIAKGFGLERLLEQHLLEKFPGQQEVLSQVMGFAHTLLENTKGGVVAGVGIALLFWTVIKVLGDIEKSFNDIWGIKQTRSLVRKFSDYLSIMLVCPILIIIASSATVFVSTQLTLVTQRIELLGMISPLITILVKLLPFCVLWVLFSFLYAFMPNTKVWISSAVLAGVITGTIYQVVQWLYIMLQVGVAQYNAIYGSFAALPLFLVWLQWSWVIVLMGAEVSFAHQNVDLYEFEPDCLKASQAFKKLITLAAVRLLVKRFSKGEGALTAADISHALEVPVRLVRQILFELLEAGIISEVKTSVFKEAAYQVARDPQSLSINSVIQVLEQQGVNDIPVARTKELEVLSGALKAFQALVEKAPVNKCLGDL